MLLIISVVSLISIAVLILKFKKIVGPVTVFFAYAFAMLFLSNSPILGVSPLSNFGSSIFLLSFISAVIGALLARKKNTVPDDGNFEANKKWLIFIAIVFGLVPVLLVAFKSFIFIFSYGYEQFVIKARLEGESADIIGSQGVALLVNLMSRPISVVAMIIGVGALLRGDRKTLAVVGIASLLLFSIVNVKRMDLMYIVVVFIFGLTLKHGVNDKLEVKKKHAWRFIPLIFIVLMVALGASGYIMEDAGFTEIIVLHGLAYHIYGFMLFDYALNNPYSYVHDFVFPGQTIFGFIDFFVGQVASSLGFKWDFVASKLYSEELGKHVFMGYNSWNHEPVMPNAFYTVLFPIYRDTGILGVGVFSFFYGYMFSREYLTYRFHQNLRSLVWVLFFSWLGYSSLLTSSMMGITFWFIPFAIYFVFNYRFRV